MAFWAEGFWAEGFWATDFWTEDAPASSAPTVSIDQGAAAEVVNGNTLQLTATSTGEPSPTLSWASDDELVATVNTSTGLVTSVALGTCTITVTADNDVEPNAQDTIEVTVRAAVSPPVSTGGGRGKFRRLLGALR